MGVVSRMRWNLWVWLVGVVVRRYIDFLILFILYLSLLLLYLKMFSFIIYSYRQRVPLNSDSLADYPRPYTD